MILTGRVRYARYSPATVGLFLSSCSPVSWKKHRRRYRRHDDERRAEERHCEAAVGGLGDRKEKGVGEGHNFGRGVGK